MKKKTNIIKTLFLSMVCSITIGCNLAVIIWMSKNILTR